MKAHALYVQGHLHMLKNTSGWIKTDNFQFVLKKSERKFEVIEIMKIPNGTFAANLHEIDLDDYSEEEIFHYADGYYDSVSDIVKDYGADANQIIAECISECQGLDEDSKPFNSIIEINAWLATIDVTLEVA